MRTRSCILAALLAGGSLLMACGGDDGPSGPSGPPVLANINGATAPAGTVGSTVVLEGSNFGTTQGAGQVLFSNGTGGTVAAAIAGAGDWTNTFIVTTVPSGAVSGAVSVQTSGGSSNSITFTITQNAPFNPSTIAWSSTTALPGSLSGHAAAFAVIDDTVRRVYVTGGADSAVRTGVYVAAVQTGGQLGTWNSGPALPGAVAFHGMVVATGSNSPVSEPGYLYVLGGATDTAGTPTTSVYRGTLDASGNVTGWASTTALPAALHSAGVAIFLGNVYVVGGSTTGGVPVTTVYRAPIQSTGDLGSWVSLPSIPSKRSYAMALAFGGYLYSFGGDSGAVSPNDAGFLINATRLNQIAYARIDLRTRNVVDGWAVNPTALTKAVSKHTAVAAGGNVLVTAGLYNGAGTGSTEETYAQFNANGTVASFNGATGSHTIVSAGGKNLFNHAAIAYTDPEGAAHVLVLGGDDVNAPGVKRAEVWFY